MPSDPDPPTVENDPPAGLFPIILSGLMAVMSGALALLCATFLRRAWSSLRFTDSIHLLMVLTGVALIAVCIYAVGRIIYSPSYARLRTAIPVVILYFLMDWIVSRSGISGFME